MARHKKMLPGVAGTAKKRPGTLSLAFAAAFTAVLAVLYASCSLDYGGQTNTSASVPEFTFKNSTYRRYRDGSLSMQLSADSLEQYKGDQGSFARNARFLTWTEDGELDTQGSCALLGINSSTEIYTMFTDILLHSHKQNMELKAQNLKWNGKTEQLTAGKNDTVFLQRDNMKMSGLGFSASGISKSFSFERAVTGTVETSSSETTGQEGGGEGQ